MNIMHIITELDKMYGAQRHVIESVKDHLQKGHRCMVITGKKGGVANEIEALGCTVIAISAIKNSYNFINDIAAIAPLVTAIRQFKPQIVIAHSSKASIPARIACYITRTPNLFTVHGWSFEKGVPTIQWCMGLLTEWVLKIFSDQYLCVSKATANYGQQWLHINNQQLHVAPNLHALNAASALVAAPTNPSPTFHILMVAEFRNQKDHQTAIQAIHLLVHEKNMQHLHFTFIGDGKNRAAIQKTISTLQLNNYITLAGETSDTDSWYRKSDVVMLTSFYEGLPITLIEALREGKAIVATDVGGVKEIINEGANGFLIEVGDAKALANAIENCYHNNRFVQMGIASRAIYDAQYQYSFIVQQMNTILQLARQQSRFA